LVDRQIDWLLGLKEERASFDETNKFYRKVFSREALAETELDHLVANYCRVELSQIESSDLVQLAKSKLGMRRISYVAYRLAKFDGCTPVEIIMFLDHSTVKGYRCAWMSGKGYDLKELSFASVDCLSKNVEKISEFSTMLGRKKMCLNKDGINYPKYSKLIGELHFY